MKKMILGMLLAILLVPATNAITWEASCLNSTHLYKETTNLFINGTLYEMNDTDFCPYGCDSGKRECNSWAGDPIPSEYFLLFEIFAIILLVVSVTRIEAGKSYANVFYPLMAMILFLLLALQGGNVATLVTETPVSVPFVVWVDYGLAIISLILFFVTLFFAIGEVVESEGDE